MLREVQIDPDVHPVVSNRCVHPHFIRAEELQENQQLEFFFFTRKKNATCWAILTRAEGIIWSCHMRCEKPHLDLKLQELHVMHCLFKHSADIYLKGEWDPYCLSCRHSFTIYSYYFFFKKKNDLQLVLNTDDIFLRILLWFHLVQGSAESWASHWSSLFFSASNKRRALARLPICNVFRQWIQKIISSTLA